MSHLLHKIDKNPSNLSTKVKAWKTHCNKIKRKEKIQRLFKSKKAFKDKDLFESLQGTRPSQKISSTSKRINKIMNPKNTSIILHKFMMRATNIMTFKYKSTSLVTCS
jgi:hypothetical protein